nr:hypothetical protein [Luteibacter rhizovicinus]
MGREWTDLTDAEIVQLWLDESRNRRKENDGIIALADLSFHAPERLWAVAIEILELLSDDEELLIASIGAGPLEDLLNRYGADFVDRIIGRARQNRRFRIAASCVWPSRIDPAIWQRLQAVVQPANGTSRSASNTRSPRS